MNAVDFFDDACMNVAQNQVADTQNHDGLDGWLHADALAIRLGFEKDLDRSNLYYNRRKTSSPTIRWLRHDDFEQWNILFEACFGHPTSKQHWHWKYRDTERPGIAAFENGRMAAFYGGMPRALLASGRQTAGIQVGDVMVHPDFRLSLRRKGPLHMVASTFLEQSLSEDAPYQLGFGFPNQRAFKVAERLGLYRQVDEIVQLNWPAARAATAPWLATVSISRNAILQDMDRLWQEMKLGFTSSILGVRDANYLQARYLHAPDSKYEWLGLRNRLTGRTICMAVCKTRSEGLEILDLIGSPSTFYQMLKGVRNHRAYESQPNIFMWITKSHVHLLSKARGQVTELGICIPTNSWVPRNDIRENIDQLWWLTGGDTDFR